MFPEEPEPPLPRWCAKTAGILAFFARVARHTTELVVWSSLHAMRTPLAAEREFSL